jgi:adenylate kinase
LENLSEITKKAESLGFLVNSKAIFSDLALENYNKLNGTAFKDLKENFNQFKEYSKSVNSNILIIPLSKIKDSKERLGIKGILTGKVKLSSNEIKNIVSRSIPFYRDILGWETKEITKRTEDLARSCPIMVEEILKENNNSLMVMTENNYERGRLYYAGLETLPIFYPKKEVKLKIVILGSPLSGKTTIASKLSRILDIPHISAGKLLEKHIEEKGIKVKEEIGKPTFNDNTLIKLIIEKIGQNNNKGFILEGFPRYKEEFKPFEKYIKNIDLLISIKFNHSEALKRFEKRLICLKCNSSFNLDTNIPIKEGECDFCNSRLEKRKDDNLEMVNKRLEEYKKAENSLFSFLKEKANKTIELPADFNIQKINLDMLNKNG